MRERASIAHDQFTDAILIRRDKLLEVGRVSEEYVESMATDGTPPALSGLGNGLYLGLFPALLIGLGHGFITWDKGNILPTAFLVDCICGAIGLVLGWILGTVDKAEERHKRENVQREWEQKHAAERAKTVAEIAEFNWSRGQKPYSLAEVVSSLDDLFRQSAKLTDVQWGALVVAWNEKYYDRHIAGEARVVNVAYTTYDEQKASGGTSAKVLLSDGRGRVFTYFIGPHDHGYLALSKGVQLRFDGKILSNLRHYTKQMDDTNMFMVVGWK